MFKKLNNAELNLALTKIRERYKKIIMDFNKNQSILNAFEERYMNALRNKMDLSVFILAEIEAVDQLYKNEEDKKQQKNLEQHQQKNKKSKSFADEVFEQNFRKIQKYPVVELHKDADDEIERLFGAVRNFIINYLPVILNIFKNSSYPGSKNIFSEFYQKLIDKFDYKGEPPISKSYLQALQRIPKDNKKIDMERYYIIKETAFLLNDINRAFNKALKNESIIYPDEIFQKMDNQWINENFSGMTNKDAYNKILEYLSNVIEDFRIKDIKKQ